MFIRCDRGVRMLLVELIDGGVQDFGFHFVVIGVKDRQPLVGLFHRRGHLDGGGLGIGAVRPARRTGGQARQAGQGKAEQTDRGGSARAFSGGGLGGGRWLFHRLPPFSYPSWRSLFMESLSGACGGFAPPPAAPLRRRGGKEARKGTQELIPKLIPIVHYEGGVQVEIGWSSGGDCKHFMNDR